MPPRAINKLEKERALMELHEMWKRRKELIRNTPELLNNPAIMKSAKKATRAIEKLTRSLRQRNKRAPVE